MKAQGFHYLTKEEWVEKWEWGFERGNPEPGPSAYGFLVRQRGSSSFNLPQLHAFPNGQAPHEAMFFLSEEVFEALNRE